MPRAEEEVPLRRTGSHAASTQSYGQFGVNAHYAFVARRHMDLYGTTQEQLGAIAVEQRKWANQNPEAQFHDAPMTMEDYHSSRWVVEPFPSL